MSSSLSQTKLNVLASKYRKYCSRRPEGDRRIGKSVEGVMRGLECAWRKVMPVVIRGWASDFQEFNHYWESEFGKECQNEQVSVQSIEDTLIGNRDKKTVIGLLYCPRTFRTTTAFLSNLPLEKAKSTVFCPLNIEGDTFQRLYEQKVGYYNESLLVFWLGLFDEQMVLGRLRMSQSSVWRDIHQLTSNRAAYEGSIKKRAFDDMSMSSLPIND